MKLLYLAFKSARSRLAATILTVLSIAISTALLLSVEKARIGARAGFSQTVSGTDLIVGARSGSVNLLLYTVFRLGDPTANVSWKTYQSYAGRREVAWTIPMSLGDSVGEFRVLGTTEAYFEHYRYAGKQSLVFEQGRVFESPIEAVLGADAARSLGFGPGDDFHISHGLGGAGFSEHRNYAYTVVGILKPTGTPVDSTIHITLGGLELVHKPRADLDSDLTPDSITAFLVGLKSKVLALRFQRDVNTNQSEALSAILPGVALAQLWQIVGTVEQILQAIAYLVVAAGLIGMLTSLLTTLNERRREIAVLRAIGARRTDIFFLLVLESTLLAALGAFLGSLLVQLGVLIFADILEARVGVPLGGLAWTPLDLWLPMAIACLGFILGFVPAMLAYKKTLSDGLTVQS